MGNVQPNYDATLAVGYEGQMADMRLSDVISRVCEPASIGFGLAVIRGTAANQVKLGAAGEFIGLSVRDVSLPAANEDVYLVGNTIGVMVKGTMFAKAIAAVTHGDPVYYTATGTLTNVAGTRVATPGAIVGTGNGAIGTVTPDSSAQVGTYTVKIVKAAANAGDFVLLDPAGDVVGYGTVAVAFSGGGLSFTLADGATDFIVGDTIPIVISGGNTLIEDARWLDTLAQNAIGRVRLN